MFCCNNYVECDNYTKLQNYIASRVLLDLRRRKLKKFNNRENFPWFGREHVSCSSSGQNPLCCCAPMSTINFRWARGSVGPNPPNCAFMEKMVSDQQSCGCPTLTTPPPSPSSSPSTTVKL
mmetsp:Transcript_37196/g.59964  ORF Transcript_37196/g.59964 Transcript_37196/m.59964 type:complete len:121 (+) Transcript_37196:221-583(+)